VPNRQVRSTHPTGEEEPWHRRACCRPPAARWHAFRLRPRKAHAGWALLAGDRGRRISTSAIAFFDEFYAVYKQHFFPPHLARTTVGSVLRGIVVEVDVISIRRVGPQEREAMR